MDNVTNQRTGTSQEQPESIFFAEMARRLAKYDVTVHEHDGRITAEMGGAAIANIFENGLISVSNKNSREAYSRIKKTAIDVSEYCTIYEKAAPLNVRSLSENYRCLAEFNETVFAAKYNAEYGFEFVVWLKNSDENYVTQGHYFSDYAAAKEDFVKRSGLVNSDRLFGEAELKELLHCVEFTLDTDDDLDYSHYENIKELKERIEKIIPEPQQAAAPATNEDPKMSM